MEAEAAYLVKVTRPLLVGVLFAFLSQLSSIGKGLQKEGVQALPEISLRPTVLSQYFGNRVVCCHLHPPHAGTSLICASGCTYSRLCTA